MKIEWKNSSEYYHCQLADSFDKKEAIRQLILKILDLSHDKKNWNLIVLDKWVDNLGRLIGNIQNENQAIGMDRGYRVAIQFLDYYSRLEKSTTKSYAKNINTITRELNSLIIEVLQDENFKAQLMKFHSNNPFNVEIADQGERIGLKIKI